MAPLTAFKVWLKSLAGKRQGKAPESGDMAENAAATAKALQAGLELTSEGIILLDDRGRVVAFNSGAHALAHAALADMRGADFWDAIPEDIAESHRSAAEQALRESGSHQFVARYPFEDQWVEYCLRQHADGLLVTLKDVTAAHRASRQLRESESCNQALFDVHPQAMWLFDVGSGHVLAANKAAAALYGMTQDELGEFFAAQLFPEGEGAAVLASLPVGDFHGEMRLCTQKKAGGQPMLVELACSSVQWQLRPAVMVSVTDVGARHLADAHLQRINEELELRVGQCTDELQRSRSELDAFTSAMLHDLKSPLHVIHGFASTLAERYAATFDAQGRHYLARIQASTHQLARLMDDVRTLTYLPHMLMAPEQMDLVPVCQRLMDDLRRREPGRQLVLEMEPSLPLVGDRKMLVIALACLLDNAWKFTSRKEQGWVQVGLKADPASGNLVLQVSDNGIGFDAAYADKLFTAFQRLHSSADFSGSGLGLAIVRRVAQLHDGQAWAVSADQGGASFFMSLPQGADLPGPENLPA